MHLSTFENIQHLNCDCSRSLKVKCDGSTRLPKYNFILVFNSNIWPNSAHLRDIRLLNLSDLEFDLSKSLKVKYDSVIGLPTYVFLLMF